MIHINLEKNGRLVTFRAQGHAGAAQKGEDLVCAAVSALVLTLSEALAGADARMSRCELNSGDALIQFRLSKRTRPILKTVLCGLDLLARAYPNHIEIRDKSE